MCRRHSRIRPLRIAVLMILDTSAIIATITDEPDSERFRTAMRSAEHLLMSSIAVLETRIVLFARLGLEGVALFDEMLERAVVVVVPFDDVLARAGFEAFRRFGKGHGHPAQLNIVDCAVYALAMARSEP